MKHRLRNIYSAIFVFVLLLVHAGLLGWQASWNSPVYNEVGHLTAGISVWKLGRFDLYRVNPPLVKCIAALPASIGNTEENWSYYHTEPFGRPEWMVGQTWIEANADNWFVWFQYGRLAVIPFSLLGGYVCYRWSRDLYGEMGGMLSLCMWCFSPNILAWGATFTPDVAATSLGIFSCWLFWRWLKEPNFWSAFFMGLSFGLAQLSKMTSIVFFVLWPVMWLLWRFINQPQSELNEKTNRSSARLEAVQLSFALVVGLYVLNSGYAYDGSFQHLGDYQFGSRLLAGEDNHVDGGKGGNIFRGTILERIPVPLPREYVRGIDLQRIDFDRKMWSYLNGEWKLGGWWFYYIEAIALKVPLGFWLIALTALFLTLTQLRFRGRWRDEVMLMLPVITLFVLVSSETGFSRFLRYLLPTFPYVFIWCGKVAISVNAKRSWGRRIAAAGLAWATISSLCIFPHCLSYFNELAGGPDGGHRYLLDANIDWGQDAFYLKSWLHEHSEVFPLKVSCHEHIDPQFFGIKSSYDYLGSVQWYAIDVHRLYQYEDYEWLLKNHEPVTKVGYSIWIYRIERNDKNLGK